MYYQANVPGLVADNWIDEDGIDFDVRIKVDALAESLNQIQCGQITQSDFDVR